MMLVIRKARFPRYGLLGVLIRRPAARPLRAPTLPRGSSRHTSSSAERSPPPPPPGQESFGQVMRRAIRISNVFNAQTFRQAFRDSPEETSFAVFCLIGVACCLGYTVYLYFTYFYSEFFTRYPPEIARSLRRALYYSNESRDDKLALKYYKLALEQCTQHRLDPFSDEVIGIKAQMAAWLEKIGNIKAAANVLSMVLADNKKWLNICETAPQTLPRAPVPGLVVGEGDSKRKITQDEFDQWVRSSRTRILGKSCGISIKLGELYADDHVMDMEKSHDFLTWAVETCLKEFRRRNTEGVKEGEGKWMTPEEIGGALESLAHSFERKEQFDLALPLFFQALRLCKDQCHMAVIMNNLAVSFAQHPPHAPYETLAGIVPGEKGPDATMPLDQPWTRKELLDSAQRWAKNALSHAKEPQGEKRTPECDQACAVALVNLGDIAAMAGNRTEARRRYEQGIKVSEKNGHAEGVKEAQVGLAKLAD